MPSRSTPRPRRGVGRATLVLVSPAFRYSTTRNAYVLRLVGGRVGPVLRLARPAPRQPPPGEKLAV